jgi:hypothetical protein
MVRQTGVLDGVPAPSRDQQAVATYAVGIKAGLAGALTIAVWFAVLDVVRGHPLYTPTVLGTALFRGGAGLDDPASLSPSLEMVVSFTWIHMLVFLIVGMAAARLLELAAQDSHVGFGVLLLFFIFEAGFIVACMLFAEPVLQALTLPAIAIGNLLAALAMGTVFWRAHRSITIEP